MWSKGLRESDGLFKMAVPMNISDKQFPSLQLPVCNSHLASKFDPTFIRMFGLMNSLIQHEIFLNIKFSFKSQ